MCTYAKGENPPWRTTWQQAPFKLLVQSRTACSRQRSVSSYITSELGRQHVHGRIHWCKCKPSHILDFTFVFPSENVGKMLRWKLEDMLLMSETVHVWDFCFEAIVLAKTLILLNLSKTSRCVLLFFCLNQFLILIPSSFLLVVTTSSQNRIQPTTTEWPKRSQTSARRK